MKALFPRISIAVLTSVFLMWCSVAAAQEHRDTSRLGFMLPDSLRWERQIPDTLRGRQPQPDSLITTLPVNIEDEGPSAEERLKAKVDSLRSALSEMSPGRRRMSAALMLAEADSLRMEYEFPRAVEVYQNALKTSVDSLQQESIKEALALGQNGLSMMKYCSHPEALTRKTVPLEEFFLYFPMKDRSWRPAPNALDRDHDGIAQATYIPDDGSTIYYTAKDDGGIRNIYRSQSSEDGWSAPALINEHLTSWSDEVYPVISADGRTMYFASKGLYGMGGYDLYMSQWDRDAQDWGEPINMGFPYSSPYDDFLFMNSDDGKYSVFASNRECARDSVTIYVLAYDAMPVRRGVSDTRELRELASLMPAIQQKNEEKVQGVNVNAYAEKMSFVRELRDSIYRYNKELDSMRSQLSTLPVEEQSTFLSAIRAKEGGLPAMQKKLDAAAAELQKIEVDFLASGVMLNMEEEEEETEEKEDFPFAKREMGEALAIELRESGPAAGQDFEIMPVGRFAESNVLPDGLVYQIEIASGSNKLGVRDLKGLSPVYERMNNALRFTYSVGVFRTYADVLSQLNSVRTLGFKDAFITASLNGRAISIQEARTMEKAATDE